MAMPHGVDWRWIALAALWLAGPGARSWRWKGAGALMLDLGYSGGRLFDLAFGAVVATGFTGVFPPRGMWPFTLLALLGAGVGFIVSGTRRFQLREAGFWNAGRLIPWDRIDAYEISETGSLNLKTPGETLKSYCNIPPALHSKTKELLATKCPSLQPKA